MKTQRVQNKVISGLNAIRYSAIEPVRLHYERIRHRHAYHDPHEKPLISITIPTYDRGQLLVDRTLPSIFAQTYQNFEILIIGDCCVDDTANILNKVKHPRVKFINLAKRTKYPNDPTLRWFVSGVAPSNYGLDIAQGKWISYFDDDDMMTPEHLESLLQFAQKGSYEFVAGLYEEERNGVRSIVGHPHDTDQEFGGHSTWLYRSYLRFFKYNIHSWRKSYNCPQDLDLQLRMRSAGVRMQLLEKVVSYTYPRPGLTTVGLSARLESENTAVHQTAS